MGVVLFGLITYYLLPVGFKVVLDICWVGGVLLRYVPLFLLKSLDREHSGRLFHFTGFSVGREKAHLLFLREKCGSLILFSYLCWQKEDYTT